MYYTHTSKGVIQYDPRSERGKKFEPWWAILICDKGIIEFYSWLSLKYGRPITSNKLWGPHISFVKGEKPPNENMWNKDYGEIEFKYSNIIRYDNGMHAWVDVECERLHEIRAEMGLPKSPYKPDRLSLHLTLGRYR